MGGVINLQRISSLVLWHFRVIKSRKMCRIMRCGQSLPLDCLFILQGHGWSLRFKKSSQGLHIVILLSKPLSTLSPSPLGPPPSASHFS